MTRYTITLPHADNDGHSLDALHRQLEEQLCDIAGGFTATDSVGAWRGDDGRVYREAVRVYAVDVHEYDGLLAGMRRMAAQLARDARQEAVYLTRQPLQADVVAPLREGVLA